MPKKNITSDLYGGCHHTQPWNCMKVDTSN